MKRYIVLLFTISFLILSASAEARKVEIKKAGDIFIISSIGCCKTSDGHTGYYEKQHNWCIPVQSCTPLNSKSSEGAIKNIQDNAIKNNNK